MSTHLDPLINTYIGPYLIRSLIGKGGMGCIYEAYHETLDRLVAIKLLSTHEVMTEDMLHMFREEARNASKCKHPNIITIYDFGVHQNTPYMVMELLKGESLHELMKRQKSIKPIELLEIIAPIANALHAFHTQGMIHRDIKPDNIFIEHVHNTLQIKLLDFGLAFFHSQKSMASHVVGTPTYMAPEQIMRQPLTPRTDVFALAAVSYYCLSGQSPLGSNASIESLLHRAMNTTYIAELSSFTSVSEAISTVIHQGMSHQAQDRPASPIEFVQALYQAIKESSADQLVDSQFNSGSLPNLTLLIDIPSADSSSDQHVEEATIESQELNDLVQVVADHNFDKISSPLQVKPKNVHTIKNQSHIAMSPPFLQSENKEVSKNTHILMFLCIIFLVTGGAVILYSTSSKHINHHDHQIRIEHVNGEKKHRENIQVEKSVEINTKTFKASHDQQGTQAIELKSKNMKQEAPVIEEDMPAIKIETLGIEQETQTTQEKNTKKAKRIKKAKKSRTIPPKKPSPSIKSSTQHPKKSVSASKTNIETEHKAKHSTHNATVKHPKNSSKTTVDQPPGNPTNQSIESTDESIEKKDKKTVNTKSNTPDKAVEKKAKKPIDKTSNKTVKQPKKDDISDQNKEEEYVPLGF